MKRSGTPAKGGKRDYKPRRGDRFSVVPSALFYLLHLQQGFRFASPPAYFLHTPSGFTWRQTPISMCPISPHSSSFFPKLFTTSPTPTFQKQCFWAHRHFLCVKICKSLGLFGVSSCTLRIFFVTLHQQTRGNGEGKSARQKDRSRCSSSA